MTSSDDSNIRSLFNEKGWPSKLLEDLNYLHSLDRDEYQLDFQDPYTMYPWDPEEWYGILVNYGYLAFGTCPNGDFIVLDCEKKVGSIMYISHEEFHYDPSSKEDISNIIKPVAVSIKDLVAGRNEGGASLLLTPVVKSTVNKGEWPFSFNHTCSIKRIFARHIFCF